MLRCPCHLQCCSLYISVLICIGLTLLSFLLGVYVQNLSIKPFKDRSNFIQYFEGNFSRPGDTPLTVLLWTGFFVSRHGWEEFYGSFNSPDCPASCSFTFDKSKLLESDVLFFNARDVYGNERTLPTPRRANQIWVLHSSEPPYYTWLHLANFNYVFNWTSFLRLDSDIPTYYGKIVKVSNVGNTVSATRSSYDYHGEKTKMAAWMASNCFSRNNRDFYVHELRKYIQVDRYGKCGDLSCPRDTCDTDVISQYKFYLAFENGNCRNYVTEKFWRALKIRSIPVVMGGGGSHLAVGPPSSYIDVANFSSPKDLANYLLYVAANKALYNSYFDWTAQYNVTRGSYWCDVCKALRRWDGRPQVYHDLDGWFKQDMCGAWNVFQKAMDVWHFLQTNVLKFLRIW